VARLIADLDGRRDHLIPADGSCAGNSTVLDAAASPDGQQLVITIGSGPHVGPDVYL
jgi:hypothetical protein